MERTEQATRLLLDVWKEVGRHEALTDCLDRIAARLRLQLPLRRLVVRRFDSPIRRLETVGLVQDSGTSDLVSSRTALSEEDTLRVKDWLARGQMRVWRRGERDPLRSLVDPGEGGDALAAGPLLERGAGIGVALFHSADEELRECGVLLAALLEPLGVALGNDVRLHEIARLKEAVEAENRALRTRLQREDISESVVGERSGLRFVMERVEQVAPTDAPVLILGETGSGKEVVARAIHTRSRRAEGPFLRVNCGAIPSELVDSELFGHEKGSFTGAIAARQGWFERADGGTLFLDELGELPLAAQVRLLRVLQDGSFERVGGQRALHVDVRIVAATHRDMQSLVLDGRFRQDLWYRVNVFPVRLPPLRERAEDIPALAEHFAASAGRRLFGVELKPSESDVRLLRGYHWPGNVRELASVIERGAILGGGRRLDVATALGVDHARESRADAPLSAPQAASPASPSLQSAMASYILDALHKCHGRIEGPHGAARLLDINPHTLRSRMRKLGIEWNRFRPGAPAP